MIVGVLSAACAMTAVRASAIPHGDTVYKTGIHFPDYVYDAYSSRPPTPGGQTSSTTPSVIVDNVNRVVIEWDVYNDDCNPPTPSVPTNFAAYDMDTMALKVTGCLGTFDVGSTATRSGSDIAGDAATAIDPVDRLIFFIKPSLNLQGGDSGVTVYSETTLKKLATWSLPLTNGGPQNVAGLSWVPGSDELIVLADNGNAVEGHEEPTRGAPQLGVYDYSIPAAIAAASNNQSPAALWQVLTVPGCANALEGYWGSTKAYESTTTHRVYLACMLHNADPQAQFTVIAPSDAVASFSLALKGNGGQCVDSTITDRYCPIVDSSGAPQTRTTLVPAPAEDLYFDSASDRGFVPCCSTGTMDMYIYDGQTNSFVGRTNAGAYGSGNQTVFAYDTTTGRAYAFSADGLTTVDTRRTPIPTGSAYPGLTNSFVRTTMPVLTPSATVPYTRVLLPHVQGQSVPYFDVYADQSPISQDPPASLIDNNTYSGPSGATARALFAGNAAGFGVHSDLVGGPGGIVASLTMPAYPQGGSTGVPFADGRRDVLGGVVDRTYLSGATGSPTNSQAAASALEPVDDGTATYYSACTDIWAVYGSCATPPCSYVALVNGAPCPNGVPRQGTPAAVPSGETSQGWPYGAATCSLPGGQAARDDTSGVLVTTYSRDSQGTPRPTQSALSGTESLANAGVDCDSVNPTSGTTTGSSRLGTDIAMPLPGGPAIHIASARASTYVEPPTSTQGVVSHVTTGVTGVRIDLGNGDALSIAEIVHDTTVMAAGRPGTATGTDLVTISRLAITQSGSVTELCSDTDNGGQLGSCRGNLQGVIDALNTRFPSLLHISAGGASDAPEADKRYFQCPASQVGSGVQCKGSAGGYTTVVQASLGSQEGDKDFNQMTPTEATFLPAMRIVLYDDGRQGLTREVLDLAGVEADAEYGIQPPDQGNCSDCSAAVGAADGSSTGSVVPGSTVYLPPPANPVTRTVQAASAQDGGLVALVERVFAGVSWLFRNPWSALQMLLFLSMLLVPPFLMVRRRTWLADMRGQ